MLLVTNLDLVLLLASISVTKCVGSILFIDAAAVVILVLFQFYGDSDKYSDEDSCDY